MKPDEAIDYINIMLGNGCIWDGFTQEGKEAFMESLEMGKKALEKHVAKKPTLEADGYDDSGNLIYDTWFCPRCETKYEVDYDDYKQCPECGQKLDWSEEE